MYNDMYVATTSHRWNTEFGWLCLMHDVSAFKGSHALVFMDLMKAFKAETSCIKHNHPNSVFHLRGGVVDIQIMDTSIRGTISEVSVASVSGRLHCIPLYSMAYASIALDGSSTAFVSLLVVCVFVLMTLFV